MPFIATMAGTANNTITLTPPGAAAGTAGPGGVVIYGVQMGCINSGTNGVLLKCAISHTARGTPGSGNAATQQTYYYNMSTPGGTTGGISGGFYHSFPVPVRFTDKGAVTVTYSVTTSTGTNVTGNGELSCSVVYDWA